LISINVFVLGVDGLMKFLKSLLMVIGGLTLVVVIATLLFGRGGNDQQSVTPLPSNTVIPQPEPNPTEPPRKDSTAEATLSYWKSWKALRERYKVAAEPLAAEYSVKNSTALSSLSSELADQLRQLSAVDVDPELVEIAASAVTLYRGDVGLLQEQANILSKWNAFIAKRDSDGTAGAGIIVFLFNEKDRFAVPRALAAEANQIKSEWEANLALLGQNDKSIQAMAAQRDAIKIKLESKYRAVFE
jgi:hypothetical protein